MPGFNPRSVDLEGRFTVTGPPDEVFQLFSPLGETRWVPGWTPELVHPSDDTWVEGQVFRTQEERGPAVWVVSALDLAARTVTYHRVEPERYVARIQVICRPTGHGHTEVETRYGFVGLTETGNRDISAMTQEEYDAKMERWRRWIGECLMERRSSE